MIKGIGYNFGIDFPEEGNVLEDDTVDANSGTFINIETGFVFVGETWGEDGTEFVGTLEASGFSIFFMTRRRY